MICLQRFLRETLFAMRAMESLQPAIRLRMRDPRLDVRHASPFNEGPPLGTEELAAVVVHQLGLAGMTIV